MAKKNKKKSAKRLDEKPLVAEVATVSSSSEETASLDYAISSIADAEVKPKAAPERKSLGTISVPSDNLHKPAPKRRWVKKKVEVVEEQEIRYTAQEFAETPNPLKKKKKKKKLTLTGKKALSGWLFCLPFVIGILGIYLPIVIKSIEVGFHGRMGNEFAFSFDAYKHAFVEIEGGMVVSTIINAMKEMIIQIPAIVIFSLFMAIILNQKMTGRAFFRAVFFLPVILSTGIIAELNDRISAAEVPTGGMDDNTGTEQAAGIMSSLDIEMLLSSVNLKITLGSKTINFVDIVTNLVNNIFEIVSRSGVQMLIFLSGLQSISPSIYESCQMEGATAWETFWKITLPMISPMILVNAIYTVVDLFTMPDNIVMQALGGYGGQFTKNPGSYSALIWVYTALSLVVIIVVALLLKTIVFYQKKD